MRKITLNNSTKIREIFSELQEKIGGSITVDAKEHIFNLENDLGRGRIKGMPLKGGIVYLEFDMEFREEFVLATKSCESPPICFAYCSRGNVSHSFGQEGKIRTLENFQTGILTSRFLQKNILYFEKDMYLKMVLILVNTPKTKDTRVVQKKTLNQKLQKLFLTENGSENYVYMGSYNLKIAERIQQLEAISQKGIVRGLLVEGLVHIILALELQQHAEDMNKDHNGSCSLTAREMKSIKELLLFIQNYPDRQHNVSDLCRRAGLSPSKLQEGFKSMHGLTVINYIREVRVRKAEDLIKNTDLNISEVVYSVGFTSRSYFSKIFKAKYNCSPKEYKNKQQPLTLTT